MKLPIIDLHCDLLSYLAKDAKRTVFDPLSHCSFPQLKEGGVKLQTLAIFTETNKHSVQEGHLQLEAFKKILTAHSDLFTLFNATVSEKIALLPAFENASSFCSEEESLEDGLKRLDSISLPLFYISLTWNGENRFGGGCGSVAGLKEDGKTLLRWMDGKKIAVDFSHTSDRLAREMIEFIDQNNLSIPLLASHSNFRSVQNQARNLPDDIAREIGKRGGLIGLVFYKQFVNPQNYKTITSHVAKGIELCGIDHLSFGADFFCLDDFPDHPMIKQEPEAFGFFPELNSSSCYPTLLDLLSKELKLSMLDLQKISHQNAFTFLREKLVFARSSSPLNRQPVAMTRNEPVDPIST